MSRLKNIQQGSFSLFDSLAPSFGGGAQLPKSGRGQPSRFTDISRLFGTGNPKRFYTSTQAAGIFLSWVLDHCLRLSVLILLFYKKCLHNQGSKEVMPYY